MRPFNKLPSSSFWGFTVVEMLVVLVLLGLVTTLLMQGFSQVLNLRFRFLEQLDIQRTGALQTHWFRELCSSVIADDPDKGNVFTGAEREMKGLTLNPLFGIRGAPTPVALKINLEGRWFILQYRERQEDWMTLVRWTGDDGGFYYLDRDREWHRQWPPALKQVHQVPEGILLVVQADDNSNVLFASPSGIKEPKPEPQDLFKEILGQ